MSMAFSVVQPWTLDVFSAFTSLKELRIGLYLRKFSTMKHVSKMTESLTGPFAS